MGIKLVSPVPGKSCGTEKGSDSLGGKSETSSKGLTLADFGEDENGALVTCPMGQVGRVSEKVGGAFITYFHVAVCKACACQNECPVKLGKFRASLRYTDKAMRLDARRKNQETAEFKKIYRKRSGIEASNSLLKRKFGLGRLRYRGLKVAAGSVTLKVLALNIWRIAVFERQKIKK